MTCEDYEVAIERRRHGALGEPERTALERHLATCASCRTFDETVRRTEATMAAMSEAALSAVDWAKVERGVRAGMSRLVVGFLALLLAVGLSVALAAWAAPGRAAERALTVVAALSPVVLAYALAAALAGRRLARLERGEEMLRTQLRIARGRARVLAVGRFLVAGVAALLAWQLLADGVGPRVRVVLGVEAAVLAALLAAMHFVFLPRVRRERSELEGMDRR